MGIHDMVDFSELNQTFEKQEQVWWDQHFDRANTSLDNLDLGSGVLLDLGIGTALPVKRLLKKNPDLRIVGVDYDLSHCNRALDNLADSVKSAILVKGEEFDRGLIDENQVTLVYDNIFRFSENFGKNADFLLTANCHWYSPFEAQPSPNDLVGNQIYQINQMAFATLLKYVGHEVVKPDGNVLELQLMDKPIDKYFNECAASGCRYFELIDEIEVGRLKEREGSSFHSPIVEKRNVLRIYSPKDLVSDKTAELCKDTLVLSYDPNGKKKTENGRLKLWNNYYRIENPYLKDRDRRFDLSVFENGNFVGGLIPLNCPLERTCQVYYQAKKIHSLKEENNNLNYDFVNCW
jgi:hypothetical protein